MAKHARLLKVKYPTKINEFKTTFSKIWQSFMLDYQRLFVESKLLRIKPLIDVEGGVASL